MEDTLNDNILIQVQTEHLSRQQYESKIRSKVTKVADKYWKKKIYNHTATEHCCRFSNKRTFK